MARVTVQNKDVIKRLAQKRLAAIEKAFKPAIEEETTRLIQRTRKATDVEGRAFEEALTEGYKKRKIAKGRKGIPDLTFTGRMLGAITTKVEKVGNKLRGIVYFSSTAEANKARGNQQIRRFFGFSKEQLARIRAKLKTAK